MKKTKAAPTSADEFADAVNVLNTLSSRLTEDRSDLRALVSQVQSELSEIRSERVALATNVAVIRDEVTELSVRLDAIQSDLDDRARATNRRRLEQHIPLAATVPHARPVRNLSGAHEVMLEWWEPSLVKS